MFKSTDYPQSSADETTPLLIHRNDISNSDSHSKNDDVIQPVGEINDRCGNSKTRDIVTHVAIVFLFCLLALLVVALLIAMAYNTNGVVTSSLDREWPYLLVDGHNDLAWSYRKWANNSVYTVDLKSVIWNTTEAHTDIPRLRKGQLGAQERGFPTVKAELA
ncbi:hypothetical protein MAR_006450, partial [Mya arenaria]